MYLRSINSLICMFMALMAVFLATLCREPYSTTEGSVTESAREERQEAGEELGALLDAGASTVVTLEAGGTRLVAHRAVLAARSPALAAALRRHTSGGRLSVPGLEGPVLRLLVAYLYTLQTPRLPPGTATRLLAAAHRFGLPALQADCERQVAAQLSAETAASVAVLAVEHSLADLRDTAVNFIKDHFFEVLATEGWSDAVKNQPTEVIQLSRLLAGQLPETSAPDSTEAGNATTASTRPHSDPSQTPATAAPPLAACPTSPLDEATVSSLRSLYGEEKGRRLMEAAEEGAVGELRALLAAGADVGARGSTFRRTALHYAAGEGHVEAASCLLGAGAEVDARDSTQQTPLHEAAKRGHAAVVRLLTAASADHNARDHDARTPLHYAAQCDDAAAVRLLLAASADPDARDHWGYTPLHLAVAIGSAEAAAALLEWGGDRGRQ